MTYFGITKCNVACLVLVLHSFLLNHLIDLARLARKTSVQYIRDRLIKDDNSHTKFVASR